MSSSSLSEKQSDAARARVRAAWLSLSVGIVVLGMKLVAWWVTQSSAVLSDALESIVNVVAAGFAVFALRFAAQPADRDHPYGHGKIEFVAASFEGGLVSFAALLILYSVVWSVLRGPGIRSVDLGLAVSVVAALANLALGAFLVRRGRRLSSATLIADGLHVLSDVWTTAGVLVGLLLVRFTGVLWFDPLAALLVGALLLRTGLRVLHGSVQSLIDKEDPELVKSVIEAFEACPRPGIIGLHRVRVIRHGNEVHVDAHLDVPEHWTVRQAHDAALELEQAMRKAAQLEGEIAFHLDPCQMEPCARCDLGDCPNRKAEFAGRKPLTVDEATKDGEHAEPGTPAVGPP